jgi:hypothetical protein
MMQAVQNGQTTTRGRGGRASVSKLYRDFEATHAAYKPIAARLEEAGYPAGRLNRKLERLIGQCHKLAHSIERTPASNTAEILLKLRTFAWANVEADYETLEDLDRQMPASVHELDAAVVLASIQADLLRLTKAH